MKLQINTDKHRKKDYIEEKSFCDVNTDFVVVFYLI